MLDYFPDAIVALARVSWAGNEQHNPGQPLHWNRAKSGDESDAMLRHFLQRGEFDTDGIRHTAKMAWRAMAALQKEIEGDVIKTTEKEMPPAPEAAGDARSARIDRVLAAIRELDKSKDPTWRLLTPFPISFESEGASL